MVRALSTSAIPTSPDPVPLRALSIQVADSSIPVRNSVDPEITARAADPTDAGRFVQAYLSAHPVPGNFGPFLQWVLTHPHAVRYAQAGLTGLGATLYGVGSLAGGPRAWLINTLGLATANAAGIRSRAGIAAACVTGGALPVVVNTVLGGPLAGLLTGLGTGVGALLTGGALFEKLVASPGWDTASYPYKDRNYAGSRLYHLADACGGRSVPVLELDAERPFNAGFAHGYLMGPQISELMTNMRHDLWVMPDFAKQYRHTMGELRRTLLPEEEAELRGMMLGFNAHASERGMPQRVVFNDLLAAQALPDMCHFQWKKSEAHLTGQRIPTHRSWGNLTMACTAVMLRGPDGHVTWGRNTDWTAFGMAGAMSLPIVWKNRTTGHDYAVLGVPGMIGAVTGWNSRGLSLAMNVVGGNTRRVQGAPATLHNRRILRDAGSVAEVTAGAAFAPSTPAAPQPLGPYHMMVGDRRAGACVSFYQGPHGTHTIRRAGAEGPLWCLNWSHPGRRWDVFTSHARQEALKAYFDAAAPLGPLKTDAAADVIEGALQLGSTNNLITVQSIVFKGEHVRMRWSNAFAATRTPVEIRRDALFQASPIPISTAGAARLKR